MEELPDVCLIRSQDIWCPSRNTNPRPLDSEAGVRRTVAERLHRCSLGLAHPNLMKPNLECARRRGFGSEGHGAEVQQQLDT
jgi:hypothetical protein